MPLLNVPVLHNSTPHLGAYIICCNEERHLGRALASVAGLDEIVVVDSGSTDRTLEIARSHGARVISHPWQGYAGQKQFALSLCTATYVLNLDADEEASPELIAELRTIAATGTVDGLSIPIAEVFLGKPMPAAAKRNSKVRFFRRTAGHYGSVAVHENVLVDGVIHPTKAPIWHYGEQSLEIKVNKINRYSSLRTIDNYGKGRKPSTIKLLVVFPLTLLKSLLLRRTILAGQRGLIAACTNAFYAFLKEAKLFEAHWAGEEVNAGTSTANPSARQ